jgi:hypothetical protein
MKDWKFVGMMMDVVVSATERRTKEEGDSEGAKIEVAG